MVIRECMEIFALLALKTTQSTILHLILLLSLISQDISNLRMLSKSQNRPAGPWPDQSFWQSDKLFPRVFADLLILLRANYLGFNISGWVVLIKSEILITTGMVWPVSSDKWKALCWYLPTHCVYQLTWWPSLSVAAPKLWNSLPAELKKNRALHLLRQPSKRTFLR